MEIKRKKLEPGDKVKITSDAGLLYKNGLEVFRENPEIFNEIFTVKYNSYGYINLVESKVNKFDFHPELLILQQD